jgi:pyruvate kinase
MQDLTNLYTQLLTLKQTLLKNTEEKLAKFPAVEDSQVYLSRRNLMDYLLLREQDLSTLQPLLIDAGLSSLSRVESNVMHSLNAMLSLLQKALQIEIEDTETLCAIDTLCPSSFEGEKILKARAQGLFGLPPAGRKVTIMVTLPTEAAWNDALIKSLLHQGMNLARINTAHDDPELWQAMVERIKNASRELRLPCKIMVDLTGPKLRTGPLSYEAAAFHIKVKRNLLGITTEPGKVLLYPDSRNLVQKPADLEDYQLLPIPDKFFARFKSGDKLCFKDSRGKNREIELVEDHGSFLWKAICFKPTYLEPKAEVEWMRRQKKNRYTKMARFILPEWKGKLIQMRLYTGDHLMLSYSPEPGKLTELKINGQCLQIAQISCQTPKPLRNLQIGDPVWIDDGKLGAKVSSIIEAGVVLDITEAGLGGVVLKEDKGLNFPETPLGMRGLSDDDRQHLDWVCKAADVVGLSFVQSQEDIDDLINEFRQRDCPDLPIIAKIETAAGLHNLPDILLNTLGQHPLGVMIARGDLAVELGAVRMAELQEEILWLCEAAHVPVVWATQVLETLAKKGVTSRPELTDAAMSVRAECVMLNKGPYISEAVRVLSNILGRMQHRTHKKVSLLKPLN